MTDAVTQAREAVRVRMTCEVCEGSGAVSCKTCDSHLDTYAAAIRAEAVATERAKWLAVEKGLRAVESLMQESRGVIGLHLNGDEARWDELRTGGRYEEWLVDFDAALDRVAQRIKEEGA